ncbi:methionine--tRNA ligase [Candidatus Nomurabacteria bacterium RIFCSPLOWO2_01_FULL_46_18]|uniref:Methionine--tRNA ligase n=1 Tax=Candidatus Nomurabacteria bacterium RIFCSPLOWO2_01_FULL_46_18 TaxID=1801783 RepID=A0A1F6XBZ8_9BACT|nr:MAG: methionine--tRNA ligase [Candidatus Nomurabacteria bacterium RIFCSPLOWO2_01_FULL_46_18]
MKKKSFYITTTIPYVNADPHIGFALELVQSDAVARHRRLAGRDVFFSTGTDEYGQKIWEASKREGEKAQDYVDNYAQKFLNLKKTLNLSTDNFIRTTSPEHIAAAQEFWRLCDKNGDIYKKKYKGLYCVGCEKFIAERDLVDGKCTIHPNLTPEIIEEENYFFKITKYRNDLLKYLQEPKSVLPEWRRKEAVDFTQNAMEDFSVSRSKERLSWGIPVPGDDTQVMYVWFGAFVNYLSTLGWPHSTKASRDKPEDLFKKFWLGGEKVQTAGKDMVKFQSVMWQGMLMSAGLPTTDTIVYHGFITGEGGLKMSKSLGNVINPNEIVKEYSTDALRYFLLREISSFEDSPFTMERFKEAYNAGLANGLGNLSSRILTLSEKYLEKCPEMPENSIPEEFSEIPETFDTKKAMDYVWNKIQEVDQQIQKTEPFKVIKVDSEKGKKLITDLITELYTIARMLNPLLPETSEKLKKLIKENKKPKVPLFLRKD